MALFGKKTEEKSQPVSGGKSPAAPQPRSGASEKSASSGTLSHVLRHARITEKASMHMERGVYVFDVSTDATKREVEAAIRAVYGVSPRKVAVVTVPSKAIRHLRTGKAGVKRGGKKAYVYLKAGDTITLG